MLIAQRQKMFLRLSGGFLLLLACIDICFGQSIWKLIDPLPQNNPLYSVTYGGSLFVAVGNSGMILTSSDANVWTIKNSWTSDPLTSVTSGNIQFVAVGVHNIAGYPDGEIFTSPNASTWTKNNVPNSLYIQMYFYSVIYGKGQFVIVGGYGDVPSGVVLTSPDAETWTVNFPASYQSYLYSIAYGTSQFVAVGTGGGIFSSPDVVTWTKRNSMTTKDLNSVVFSDSLFVAVGAGGTILTSPDDSIWTIRNSNTTNAFNSITYGNNQFVIVGDSGRILTSHDAMAWTAQNSGTTKSLRGLVYADSQFVAVGDSGVILTSKADGTGIAFQPKSKLPDNSRIKVKSANGRISVILPNATKANSYRAGLFTVAGKKVYSTASGAHDDVLNIPASGFPACMYYILIEGNHVNTMSSAFFLAK
jgi:hypothetical protein